MRLGYAFLIVVILASALGHIPDDVVFRDGLVIPSFGWWILLVIIPTLTIITALMYFLVHRLRTSNDPVEYNRLVYILAGAGILTILNITNLPPIGDKFPFGHIGQIINTIILTYVTLRYRILDLNLIARRALLYISMIIISTLVYTFWLWLVHQVLGFTLSFALVISVTLLAFATLAIFWVRTREFLSDKIDVLFYGESYDYRQKLNEFVRNKIRGVFSLKELSEGLLPPLVKVLNCQRAFMLLPEPASGDLVVEFSEPSLQNDSSVRIKKDSPIILWFKRENRYLTKEKLEIIPEFRGLWTDEIDKLKSLDLELLFPLLNQENIVGILALSRRQSGKYSLDDVNLLQSIAGQVAISLEKEHFQEELVKREQELSLLNRLAIVINSSLNIQEVYEAFITELREVIEVDFATVALIEGKELRFSALSSKVGSAWKLGESIRLRGTATEWVIRNKKSLLEPDLEQDSIFHTGKEYLKRGIRSIVYLPLITKDEGIGSLIISSRNPNAYTPRQIDLLERLASQISTSVVNSQLYTRAEQRARIDELTGLYNRRHFDQILKHEIDRHSRYGSMLSLAFIDLDNLKKYNDALGHQAGDKLLAQIGHLLQSSVRNIDIAFRYGGDEFAVIMPNTSDEDSHSVAERIRNAIANEYVSKDISVTASFGLASWPSDGLTVDHIVNAADKALYHAKRTGGNRICLVSQMLPLSTEIEEAMPDAEKETLNIIYALASTIEARDIYTYGHSQKVRTHAVALAEALCLPPEKVAIISHAALLHDIGKIGIYDEILNKASKLDESEFELIKTHPDLSRTIVGHVSSLTPCLPAIHQHHESWDGTGYPTGLKSESICIEARILAIADAFDAMTSKRPYRAPLSYKEAVQELKRCSGTQFDPKLVKIFIPIVLSTSHEDLMSKQHPAKSEI